MKKLILLILSSFSLVGCASNELADSEKESLLNEQKAIEFQKGEVKLYFARLFYTTLQR